MQHSVLRVLLLIIVLPATACRTVQHPLPLPAAAAEAVVADRLFFGRSIPGGGSVSEPEWERFMAEVVTPRFPKGLTVWRGAGQWLEASGTLAREETCALEVFHSGTAAEDAAIREIAEEYKRRFRQEAVLRVTAKAVVLFY